MRNEASKLLGELSKDLDGYTGPLGSNTLKTSTGRVEVAGACRITQKLHSEQPMMRGHSINGMDSNTVGVTVETPNGGVEIVDLIGGNKEGAYLYQVIQIVDGEILIPWTNYEFVRNYIESLTDEEKTYIIVQQKAF